MGWKWNSEERCREPGTWDVVWVWQAGWASEASMCGLPDLVLGKVCGPSRSRGAEMREGDYGWRKPRRLQGQMAGQARPAPSVDGAGPGLETPGWKLALASEWGWKG